MVKGTPTPRTAPMCTRPKYFAQMNSLSGTVPPNPKPQKKNATNIAGSAPSCAEISMSVTPVAEIESAVAARLRTWTRCRKKPHANFELRFAPPLTAIASAASARVKPWSVMNGIACTSTAVSAIVLRP